MSNRHDADAATLADLRKRIELGVHALAELRAKFPEAHPLTTDDRSRSRGKFGDGEAIAFAAVHACIEHRPELFASLADEDEGHDPNKLEVGLLKRRLEEHNLYAQLAAAAQNLADVLSDKALTVGAQVKPVTLAAYEIAKPVSKRDEALRGLLAPALDYYRANATGAAATRAAHKKPSEP